MIWASPAKELLKDGYPDPKTYYIIVDLQWQVVMVYKRLDDGTTFGKPDLAMTRALHDLLLRQPEQGVWPRDYDGHLPNSGSQRSFLSVCQS